MNTNVWTRKTFLMARQSSSKFLNLGFKPYLSLPISCHPIWQSLKDVWTSLPAVQLCLPIFGQVFITHCNVGRIISDKALQERTRTGRVRTGAPGLSRFSHPPAHWLRAAAPPPLFYLGLLPGAAQYHLGSMPTLQGKAQRLGCFLSFIKVHCNKIIRYPCKNISYIVLVSLSKHFG